MTDLKGATPDMVHALTRQTPPERVQWRGDRTTHDNAKIALLAYVDARYVMDTLDELVLPENWQDRYEDIPGGIRGGIGILVNGEWVWKWDAAPMSDIEGIKGGHSDSMKRAGVKWGIARDLYDYPDLWVPAVETRPNSGKYKPASLPVWTDRGWQQPGAAQARPAAPQRPVAAPAPVDADPYADIPWDPSEAVPYTGPVPEFKPIGGPPPMEGDECPLHPGSFWKGTTGDLYHKKPEGGYCRPAGQAKKVRSA